MKRKVIAALLLGMAITVTGCSGNTTKDTDTTTEAASDASSETTADSSSESEAATEAAERPDYKALDYVKLGDYKGLEVTLASTDVTDEEVEQQVETNLNNNDKSEEIKEGTVENGDVANIDYEGKLNGKAFDGGTAKGYDLTIGSGSFIDGFEDGLIGKKIGDTVDLNLTFPKDYSSTDLAGKEVVFTVKINSVKRAPKLTDELAAEISNNEYKTAEAYNNYIKEDLEKTKKENQHNQELNDLVALAYQNATVNDYPQEMIDYQLEQVTSYYKSYADQYGMEYADFLKQQVGMTEEEFVKKIAVLPGIRIRGFMTSAPFVENPEDNRKYFRELKQLLVDINNKNIDNVYMNVLSMGMTNDYTVAVEEGATHVRVGTAIFGARDYSH